MTILKNLNLALLIGLICCAQPTLSLAQGKYLYIMGGGGDPDGKTTIFDSTLNGINTFATDTQWKTTISFDGGHADTESILQKNFAGTTNLGSFTAKTYAAMISDIRAKLLNGQIAKGDQLALFIDSHGAKNQAFELSHSVATADTGTVSLDSLNSVVALAKLKGVKLAIIDGSCYSGNTLRLSSRGACIISAAGLSEYGYSGSSRAHFLGFTLSQGTFFNNFTASLREGKDLESLFLKARNPSSNPDFPMISTPIGQKIQAKLYDLMATYLVYEDTKNNDLSTGYTTNNLSSAVCRMEQNYENTIQALADWGDQLAQRQEDIDLAPLKKALENYRDFQKSFEDTLLKTKDADEAFKAFLDNKYPGSKYLFADKDFVTAAHANYDKGIDYFQNLVNSETDPEKKKLQQYQVDCCKKMKAIIEDAKANLSPHDAQVLADYDDALKKARDNTYSLAYDVGVKLKDVYDKLYRSEAKLSNQSNDCKDFVL